MHFAVYVMLRAPRRIGKHIVRRFQKEETFSRVAGLRIVGMKAGRQKA